MKGRRLGSKKGRSKEGMKEGKGRNQKLRREGRLKKGPKVREVRKAACKEERKKERKYGRME